MTTNELEKLAHTEADDGNLETMLGPENIAKGKWWNRAWTLVEGCTPVDESCDHCWAAAKDRRFHSRIIAQPGDSVELMAGGLVAKSGKYNSHIILRPDKLHLPIIVKKPTVWAIWNDLFHKDVPFEFAARAMANAMVCRQHIFMVVTKRPDRMRRHCEENYRIYPNLMPNVWGVFSVCNQRTLKERIEDILNCPVSTKIINIEPCLGPVNLHFKYGYLGKVNPDGVFIGCESGHGRRECKIEWMESVVNQCADAGIPCWVKLVSINGKVSHDMNDWPKSIRVRQLPEGK